MIETSSKNSHNQNFKLYKSRDVLLLGYAPLLGKYGMCSSKPLESLQYLYHRYYGYGHDKIKDNKQKMSFYVEFILLIS